jgi:hypothetical protein
MLILVLKIRMRVLLFEVELNKRVNPTFFAVTVRVILMRFLSVRN